MNNIHYFPSSYIQINTVYICFSDKNDNYGRFSFKSNYLESIGLVSPAEQYFLYGSVLLAFFGSLSPLYRGYYLNKWVHEKNEEMKIMITQISDYQVEQAVTIVKT